MFKLGKLVKDKASGLGGCLTHMYIQGVENSHITLYNFQPASLDEDGVPAKRTWITPDRIEGEECPDPDIDLSVLGSQAEDVITGFKGTVTTIIFHLNGCVHLELQPKGHNKKTGQINTAAEFDIRVLSGPKIPKMTEKEKEVSQVKNPSPIGYERPFKGR